MSDYFGKETPKLGFGLMRLPKKEDQMDIEQIKHMVDLFMEGLLILTLHMSIRDRRQWRRKRWWNVIPGKLIHWHRS